MVVKYYSIFAPAYSKQVLRKVLKINFKNVAEIKIKSTFAVPIQTGKRSEKVFKKYFKNVAENKIKSIFAVPIQTGKRSEKVFKKFTKKSL